MGNYLTKPPYPNRDESAHCLLHCEQRRHDERFHFRETKPLVVNIMPPSRYISDFTPLSVIGEGSFGVVLKVLERSTGEVYAMKYAKPNMDKRFQTALERGRYLHCYCRNDFIISVVYTCATDFYGVVFLEFAPCGDLEALLAEAGSDFTEDHAFFFAAQIFYAIEYLHRNYIAHRDLKPDNVFLSTNGFVKVGDLGLAIYLKNLPNRRAKTLCGTPGFMAPEVVRANAGYGLSCDWYSYGVLVYRLIMGFYPFGEDFGKVNIIHEVKPRRQLGARLKQKRDDDRARKDIPKKEPDPPKKNEPLRGGKPPTRKWTDTMELRLDKDAPWMVGKFRRKRQSLDGAQGGAGEKDANVWATFEDDEDDDEVKPLLEDDEILFGNVLDLCPVTRDLIHNLLVTHPKARYGCGKLGADQIRHHPWFRDDILCLISARRPICPFETRTKDWTYRGQLDHLFQDF